MTILISGLELDAASYPAWRDRIVAEGISADPVESRSYPGYPRWPLDPVPPGKSAPLEDVIARRRCRRDLSAALPSRPLLSRLLRAAHGVTGPQFAGPTPSAGGLQALELYFLVLESAWLPAGAYHYDRPGHHLAQIVAGADRGDWTNRVPSLDQVRGGALLWVIIGDSEKVTSKYGDRAMRFLLLEAGHLMQNLCLLSEGLGLATVPLGGYFERDIARHLQLPRMDLVLYLGICGEP